MLSIQIGTSPAPLEAFAAFSGAGATLITGLLAVVAAYLVGRRQASIASRQVEIIGRQTGLQELAHREALFDRRFAVYAETQHFMGRIMREANAPPFSDSTEYLIAMDRAKFLFGKPVEHELREIWKQACQLHALKGTMKHIYDTEGHYGDGNPEREYQLMQDLTGRFENLPTVFGADMSLSPN